MTRRIILPALFLAGCAHAPPAPGGGAETVLSLRGLDCQSCGRAVEKLVSRQPGVAAARFDEQRAEVRVRFDAARTDPAALAAAVARAGYDCEVGEGRGAYRAEVTFDAGADVDWISTAGEDVDLRPVAGKVTVFDFYAVWCGPCRDVDAFMTEVLRARRDVALRKLNIVAWDSPAARRYLRDVPALPYLEVYSSGGRRVAAISGLDLSALQRAIEEGGR